MEERKNIGRANKRKGSNAERLYAKLFRELGFTHCKTSRQGSRLYDDSGIDLINLPFNIQIKAGYHKGMNPSNVLQYTKDKIKENFPHYDTVHSFPIILIHSKSTGRGTKRGEFDDLVTMSFQDFKKLIEGKYVNNIIEGTSPGIL